MDTTKTAPDGACLRPEPPTKIASIHCRNGEELVVALDPKNADYLNDCLGRSSGKVRVAWFERTDGCFVGLRLTELNAVLWSTPSRQLAPPALTTWDPDHLVVHFTDKETVQLADVSGDKIERPGGAMMSNGHLTAFHTARSRDGGEISIDTDNVIYITAPAAWLNSD